MTLRRRWPVAGVVVPLLVLALAGCSQPSPTQTATVTTTATVTEAPQPLRMGLALPPVDGTARFGEELLSFLQSNIEGLNVDYRSESGGCEVGIAVYGSQLAHGALDYETFAVPSDECDTDGVSVFRRVRDFAVVAEAATCFGCDEGVVDDTLYQELVGTYGNREAVDFEFNGSGSLEPAPDSS